MVAVCVEAGDIVVYDFYLLSRKAGVFIEDNFVLLAVLREGGVLAGAERGGEQTDGACV